MCPPLTISALGAGTLSWDVRRPPSSATFTNNHRGAQEFTMRSPATSPPTSQVTISYRLGIVGRLWGSTPLRVTGSPATIECVLEAIYKFFHSAIKSEEYASIDADDHLRNPRLLSEAQYARTQLAINNDESIWRVELRRVDCLDGNYIFQGLQVTYPRGGGCELVLVLGPSRTA